MAVFNDHLKNLLNLVAKRVLGKEATSDISINLESVTRPHNIITPYDVIEGTGLNGFPYPSGIHKPGATEPEKNLFNFRVNLTSSDRGRIATIYGIDEVSYSDTDTSDKGQIVDHYRFTHDTFNLVTQGVSGGDVLFLLDNNTFYVSDSVFTGPPSGMQFPINTFSGVTPGYYDALILKQNAVKLYTVPKIDGQGEEQAFLMVDSLGLSVLDDLDSLNTYRLRPLMPPRKNTLIDSMFNGYPTVPELDTEWDFGIVLYPDNGSGAPDYTKPIVGPKPIIDSTKPLAEQDVIIDYMNGSIYLTIPPRSGDAFNPNGVSGPINLWAVFAVITPEFNAENENLGFSRGVSDFPNALNSYPSYFKYDKDRKIWVIFSGDDYLDPTPADQPLQGFGIGETRGSYELGPGMLFKNNQWEMVSQSVDEVDNYPALVRSGKSGGANPGFGVRFDGLTTSFYFDSVNEKWNLDYDFKATDFKPSRQSFVELNPDRFAIKGDYLCVLSGMDTATALVSLYDISELNASLIDSVIVPYAQDVCMHPDSASKIVVVTRTETRFYEYTLVFSVARTRVGSYTYLKSYCTSGFYTFDNGTVYEVFYVGGVRESGGNYYYVTEIVHALGTGNVADMAEVGPTTLGVAGNISTKSEINVFPGQQIHTCFIPYNDNIYVAVNTYTWIVDEYLAVPPPSVVPFASIGASGCFYDSVTDYLYVISESNDTLKIYTTAGVEQGTYSSLDTPVDVVVDGNTACVVCQGTNTIDVLDITTPASISLIGQIPIVTPIQDYVISSGKIGALGEQGYFESLLSSPYFEFGDLSAKDIICESIVATATATDGTALKGIGAVGDAIGVEGVGHGSGPGVFGTGGDTNGIGVSGLGTGTGYGLYGSISAGGTAGVYGSGTGATTNGIGVEGVGKGNLPGIKGTGGNTGIGIEGISGGSSGVGVKGSGAGTDAGVWGIGGGTDAPGVYGVGGATNGIGVYGAGSGTGVGVYGTGDSGGVGVYGLGSAANIGGIEGLGGNAAGTTVGGFGLKGTGGDSYGTYIGGTGVIGIGGLAVREGTVGGYGGIGGQFTGGDGGYVIGGTPGIPGKGIFVEGGQGADATNTLGLQASDGAYGGEFTGGDGGDSYYAGAAGGDGGIGLIATGGDGGVPGSGGSNGVSGTGIKGIGGSSNGKGVEGISTNSIGVEGVSTASRGVSGSSTNGYGVYGSSTNDVGIYGTSNATDEHGVEGRNTSSGYGIYGTSNSGVGGYFGGPGAAVRFAPQSSATSTLEGSIYYDSGASKLKVYTGSGWETVSFS